jgi:hypothetical protein
MSRFAAAALLMALAIAAPRAADACRVLELDFTPSDGLQIVAWLEDADGQFVDTLFITDATGRYGIANRPGIMEFNSEFMWPYGRRETVFPVWAHRRGVRYPRLVFQDGLDRDLSHAFNQSSAEPYFCRPLRIDEPVRQRSIDTGSCATVTFTDKGKFAEPMGGVDAGVSLYPPRSDLTFVPGTDHPDVQQLAAMNDLDAVSRATPPGGAPYTHAVSIPNAVPDGEYTIWVEVGKELDFNDNYRYPSPTLQAYGDYGVAYRGQPSVLWSVPILLDREARVAQAADYAGYGDPDGVDGLLRTPDPTITADTDGSGARRLLLAVSDDGMYRVRVRATPSEVTGVPDAPPTMTVVSASATDAEITFIEPAHPLSGGPVKAFEVRIGIGQPLDGENFVTVGRIVPMRVTPRGPGTVQTIALTNLVPETRYWVGIVALDDCLNPSTPTIVELTTERLLPPEVAACFVATAAWGSPLEEDVGVLRGFRDGVLRQQVLGEILVETYYAFGPALAGVIRPSETLRAVARGGLEPVVRRLGASRR